MLQQQKQRVFLRVEKYLLSPRILIIKRASNKARHTNTKSSRTYKHPSCRKNDFHVYDNKGSSLCSVKCFHPYKVYV